MRRPLHAQLAPAVADDRRARVKCGADLCRGLPAVYAAVMRRADQLRATGIERDDALAQVLDEVI